MFKFRKQEGSQAKRNLKAKKPRTFQWRKSWNWGFLMVPLILGVVYLAQTNQVLPIRSIQLMGTFENLDQREVESTLQGYIGQGFFSLDIHQLQQTLKAKSWTDSVSVRRVWPDKLRVTITEKRPIARWDDDHLLSHSASVFAARSADFGHLPLVHADNHRPDWVLRQFQKLQAQFNRVDERLVSLQVDNRGALDVTLINGLQIKLGRDQIDHKIDRLVNIYQQQILPRREQIKRIDLRYSNGFAVAWKKEALQGSDKASIWSNSNV
ncbi:MAG: FtsQ-type POTRA domain-containing protein [Gammaproteobacteria bacterium]|nr:FtsQ-type POTRA domain-containing protein [Gammaproteobacteria bacterium]